MSDDLTPSFQEPEGEDLGRDEAAEVILPHDPFDLNSWMSDDERIIGFVGSLKYMDIEGVLKIAHVQIHLDDFESLGMHQRAQAEINNRIDMESFVYNHLPSAEDEED